MNDFTIHTNETSGLRLTYHHLVLVLFWITLLFQLTTLKHIWAIADLSRIINSATLIFLIMYVFYAITSLRYNKNVWIYYIIPGLLVYLGFLFNFSINTLDNYKVINYFGLLVPWAMFLIMPALLKKMEYDSDKLWQYFYYFMLVASSLGILEYYLFFSDIVSMRIISIPGGKFYAGSFSLLHLLSDGSAHSRLYACFGEPGNLAMLLLPVILYAYYHKKYVGLAIFLLALYLTNSLGGYISFFLMVLFILFLAINKRKLPVLIPVAAVTLISLGFIISYLDNLNDPIFQNKSNSIASRVSNIKNTMINLPDMLVDNPIGFELTEGTSSTSKNPHYYGSNFAIGYSIQMGGISAFLGYSIILIVSIITAFSKIITKNLSNEEKVVCVSLIVLFPFIFQRSTVWDSAIFAFLFSPFIIRYLQSR